MVGYMYQTLTSSWRWDLNRLDTSEKIGKERAAYLYDGESSPYDHPIVGARTTPARNPKAPKQITSPIETETPPAAITALDSLFGFFNAAEFDSFRGVVGLRSKHSLSI